MEIGGPQRPAQRDQQGGGVDVEAFDGSAVVCHRPHASEHLATDFPGIMATAPRVRNRGSGQGGGEGIHYRAGHECRMPPRNAAHKRLGGPREMRYRKRHDDERPPDLLHFPLTQVARAFFGSLK